jgi:hypothetical protein
LDAFCAVGWVKRNFYAFWQRPFDLCGLSERPTDLPSPFSHAAGPKLPENFKEDTWTKLKTAVQAILQHEAVQSSLEELFQVL